MLLDLALAWYSWSVASGATSSPSCVSVSGAGNVSGIVGGAIVCLYFLLRGECEMELFFSVQ